MKNLLHIIILVGKALSSVVPGDSVKSSSIKTWRPPYLRQGVLGAFFLVFLSCTASLQALLYISTRDSGFLSLSTEDSPYTWKYGPMVLLTILASLWSRVDYQTRITAPWLNMHKRPSIAAKSLLLDYVSMFQPQIIVEAIRYQDYTVAAVTTISIMLRINVLLSTALIAKSPTLLLRSDMPIILKGTFINNPARLQQRAALAYHTLHAELVLGIPKTYGVSQDYAFQPFDATYSYKNLTATVDGLSGDLKCEEAHVEFPPNFNPTENTPFNYLFDKSPPSNLTLTSKECDMNFTLKIYEPPPHHTHGLRYFGGLISGGCGGSSDPDDQRLGMIWASSWDERLGTAYINVSRRIIQSMVLVCKPTYNIRSVDVTLNDAYTDVFWSKASEKWQLSNVHPWDIIQAHNDGFYDSSRFMPTFSYEKVIGDPLISFAFQIANASGYLPPPYFLFSLEAAQNFLTRYYRRAISTIAHTCLVEPISSPWTGSAWVYEDRLVADKVTANTISALFIISNALIIVVWTMFSNFKVLPRNPSSLLDYTALLSQSRPLLKTLHGMGASNEVTLTKLTDNWYYTIQQKVNIFSVTTHPKLLNGAKLEHASTDNSKFCPSTLHPVFRSAIFVVLIGLIISLEATLRLSQRNSGIGRALENTYIHYFWTSSPAIVFGIISLYFNSVDFETRCLTPFFHLRKGSTLTKSIALNLFDHTPPFVLLTEFRSKSLLALVSTTCWTFASFLTIFSASLFYPATVPKTLSTQIKSAAITYNGLKKKIPDGGVLAASLFLMNNMTYTPSTHNNLVVPRVNELEQSKSAWSELFRNPGSVTNARLTTVRSYLNCRLYDQSKIRTNLSLNSIEYIPWPSYYAMEPVQLISPLRVDIDDESWSSYFGACEGEPGAVIGFSNREIESCSDFLWIWGHWNLSLPNPIASISALACNESLETVEADATFLGAGFSIDRAKPPVTDESTRQVVAHVPNRPSIYRGIGPKYFPTNNLGVCFTMLTQSRYAIPVEMLGKETESGRVEDAIRFQHGIVRAHSIEGQTNLDRYYQEPLLVKKTQRNATVTDQWANRRVLQDPIVTRIIQALLAVTFLLSGTSWFLMGSAKILYRKPTGIAHLAALLADSNLFDNLPVDAPWASMEELSWCFGANSEFKLGWRAKENEKNVFTVYVDNTDDVSNTENVDEVVDAVELHGLP
ncbi:hypothetical protein EV127DRAFT_348779 [Xylaria flabelliformis]|nr:hypothetical protein EV127DRAFT_348779 [Xylaria flabelliformis]